MPLTAYQVMQNHDHIVALLGQSGMGAVYCAWDTRLRKPVALKGNAPQPGLDAQTLAQLHTQFEQETVAGAPPSRPGDRLPRGARQRPPGDGFVEGENLGGRIRREGASAEGKALVWASHPLDAPAHCHEWGMDLTIRPATPEL